MNIFHIKDLFPKQEYGMNIHNKEVKKKVITPIELVNLENHK